MSSSNIEDLLPADGHLTLTTTTKVFSVHEISSFLSYTPPYQTRKHNNEMPQNSAK